MAYRSWVTTLAFLYCSPPSSSGQTITTTGSIDLPAEGWIVVGVIIFAVIFVLIVTWVLFTTAVCKTDREYRTFLKSLKKYRRRRQQNQQRRQARSPLDPPRSRQPTPARTQATHTRPRPLPSAISYRRDLQSPAEIYVSLAQLTTMLRGTQPLLTERTREEYQEDPMPSAPFPNSPPDYYECMSQQEFEYEQMQQQPGQLLEEETGFNHGAEEQIN